jgi:hypothetical protein
LFAEKGIYLISLSKEKSGQKKKQKIPVRIDQVKVKVMLRPAVIQTQSGVQGQIFYADSLRFVDIGITL